MIETGACDPKQEIYSERRRRLAEYISSQGGGVAIIGTAPKNIRSGDVTYRYRPGSDFWYLTGFNEPNGWLFLSSSGYCILFCEERKPEKMTIDGPRLGTLAAPMTLGVDVAFDVDRLYQLAPEQLADQPAIWLSFESDGEMLKQVYGWLTQLRLKYRTSSIVPRVIHNLAPQLAEMRLRKDQWEIATLRRAANISADAHLRVMQFCGKHYRNNPAHLLSEYEIEAELLHEFRKQGAQDAAYPPIVASGVNACVLHHSSGKTLLQPKDLCLIDAGCEFNCYASDLTRTFPTCGKFNPHQRELYEIVLAAQAAAIAVTIPGARRIDAHWAAVRVLAQGMLDTRLLVSSKVGNVDSIIESGAHRKFFMHITGHWLGLDVHDVGEYIECENEPIEQIDILGGRVIRRPSRVLEEGMVTTIEPGIYVRPSADVPEHYWNIGIRIEDVAVVTDMGCELISRHVPVAADEVERLMQDASCR